MFGRPNLLVWGGYVMLVLWNLYSIQNGSLTGYGTMGIVVHRFAGTLGAEFILMVDNDQLRRGRGVREFLGREKVQCMDCLAYPPDMNPIEHVWHCLYRRMAASNVQCGTHGSLERELVDDLGMILEDIRKLI